MFGHLIVPIRLIRTEIRNRVKQEIVDEICITHQNSLAQFEITPESVVFSQVYYKVEQSASVTIKNNSDSEVVYSLFYDVTLSWLTIKCESCVIPANQSAQIQISVLFTEKEAQKANYNPGYLRLPVKVFIIGSPEKNFSIQADFKSCFGSLFHDLVKILSPISNLPRSVRETASKNSANLEIPKELFIIIESIKAIDEGIENLFEIQPDLNDIVHTRAALDNLNGVGRASVQALFAVLLELLEALPRPLISVNFFDEFIKENQEIVGFGLINKLKMKLDAVQFNCFNALVELLKWIYSKCNALIDQLVEEFMYSLLNLKRASKDPLEFSMRKLYLKLLVSE